MPTPEQFVRACGYFAKRDDRFRLALDAFARAVIQAGEEVAAMREYQTPLEPPRAPWATASTEQIVADLREAAERGRVRRLPRPAMRYEPEVRQSDAMEAAQAALATLRYRGWCT